MKDRKFYTMFVLWMILCILSIVFSIKSILSESSDAIDTTEQQELDTFIYCDQSHGWRIYYHKDTHVMYVYCGNALTLMVNPDGSPMIYYK